MYVFKTDHLVLDNQLVFSSPVELFPHSQLTVVVCGSLCRVKPPSPTLACPLVSSRPAPVEAVMLLRLRQPLILQWDTVSQQTPWSLAFIIFTPLLQCLLNRRCRSCAEHVCVGTRLYNFTFWFIVAFCNNFHLLQIDVSLMRDEDYTYLWV